MTEFNIGDRVRLADDSYFAVEARGETGTIASTDDIGLIRVSLDNYGWDQWDDGCRLTLIDPPTTAVTLRSRADELTAKAEANHKELRELQERANNLDREAWSLNGLAAQYRAVADDLESS